MKPEIGATEVINLVLDGIADVEVLAMMASMGSWAAIDLEHPS